MAVQRGNRSYGVLSLAACLWMVAPAVHAVDIAGVYTGFYICSQGYTPLKLAIVSEGSGALQAVFAFQPPGGAPGGVKETAYTMKGQYTAQTGQFRLNPDRWATTAPLGYQMVGVSGTYDTRSDKLRATISFPGCSTVEVKRDAALSAQLSSQISTTQQQVQNLPPGAILTSSFPQTCLAFVAWTARIEKEYPGEDFDRITLDKVYPKINNLLEDEYFARFFGKNYDQLTPQDRRSLMSAFGRCYNNPQYRRVLTWAERMRGAFTAADGSPGYAQVMAVVIERRRLRQDLALVLNQAKNLPGQAAAWDQALALEAQAKRFQVLWPSEIKDLDGSIQAAKRRAATPSLEAKLKTVLASAQGFEGLQTLEQWPTQQAALISAADPSATNLYRQQIAAKSTEIINGLLAAEREEMRKIPSGLAGLQQGVAWNQRFQSRFGQRRDRVGEDILREFSDKRRQSIIAAQPQLTRMVQQVKTASEVDSIFQRYLPLPSDRQSPAMASLTQIAKARTDSLERAAILGAGSNAVPRQESSKAPTAAASASAGDPATRPPTEAEMYDALKSLLDNYNAGMKSTEASCREGGFENDPIRAVQCMFIIGGSGGRGGIQAKITGFRKIACEKARERAGWICDYRLALSISGATIPPSLEAMMGAGEVAHKRFVLDGNRWLALKR